MIKRKNLNGYNPGSIYRIALENFVTYKSVELYPGQKLNLILGPNGTGKSTFVCAIVLGLCGKVNVIGRAKNIGDYIKSGHNQATIEIELYRKPGEDNVIITRNFNSEHNSVWSIDNKPVKMKQVQELIDALNIKVDNLCQLLPQDRVQDFSKMNPQELLKSTQVAISGQAAVDLLTKLIEMKGLQRSSSAVLCATTKDLATQEEIQSRMQHVIKAIENVDKMKNEIDLCKKKRLWIEYERLIENVDELTKDKNKATQIFDVHQKKMMPLENEIKKTENVIKIMENARLQSAPEMAAIKNKMRQNIESCATHNTLIEDLRGELETKILKEQSRISDIKQAEIMLLKMKSDKNNLYQLYGDDSLIQKSMKDLQGLIDNNNSAITSIKNNKSQLEYELQSKINPQIRLNENKIRSLEDISNKRLEALQNYSDHAFKAVNWLRQNMDIFQGNVHEPIMLELNFSDPRYARYLEYTVAARDLVAFVFESSDDMNLFLKKVRTELKLNLVNAVCSPIMSKNFSPPVPISQLKKYGFTTYLADTISAPQAILQYLCKSYNIHRIPIGNDKTYEVSQNVPETISYFFSENHRFVSKISSYSGAKSVSTTEIHQARLLAGSIDNEALNMLQEQLELFKKLKNEKVNLIKQMDQQLSTLEHSENALLTKRKTFHETQEQLKTILSRIRMQEKKIHSLKTEQCIDVDKEKAKCQSDVAKCVLKQCALQKDVVKCLKAYCNKIYNKELVEAKLDITRKAYLNKLSELREVKINAQGVQQTLDNIVAQLTRVRGQAKEKLSEAKAAIGRLLPTEEGFPFAAQFLKLPSNLNQLHEHAMELQTKIECTDGADRQVIKDFEDREKNIKNLRSDVTGLNEKIQKIEKKMSELKNQWLIPLQQQVVDIDRRFGEMFGQLGCAGEVHLTKFKGDDDYDEYGISVLVKFREEEELQQLTRHTQSGGERALATALYLMALQQLSKAPFRCVDEINQGMDKINERKMFELLVKITTECDASSQYFLLTPKLLSDLEYTPSIKVHIVENGQRIMKYKRWKFDQFVNKNNVLSSSQRR